MQWLARGVVLQVSWLIPFNELLTSAFTQPTKHLPPKATDSLIGEEEITHHVHTVTCKSTFPVYTPRVQQNGDDNKTTSCSSLVMNQLISAYTFMTAVHICWMKRTVVHQMLC